MKEEDDTSVAFRLAWNAHSHTMKVRDWTPPRCQAIRRAIRAGRDVLGILSAFDVSEFLCGTRPRGEGHESFRATVDWCLKPANLVKILEGVYADQPSLGLGLGAVDDPLAIEARWLIEMYPRWYQDVHHGCCFDHGNVEIERRCAREIMSLHADHEHVEAMARIYIASEKLNSSPSHANRDIQGFYKVINGLDRQVRGV